MNVIDINKDNDRDEEALRDIAKKIIINNTTKEIKNFIDSNMNNMKNIFILAESSEGEEISLFAGDNSWLDEKL